MAPSTAIDTVDTVDTAGESRDTLLVLGARNIHAGVVVEKGRGLEHNAEHLDGHAICFED
jgi:hypothetical protein